MTSSVPFCVCEEKSVMDYIHLSSDIINSFVSVQSKTAPEGFFFVHASFLYLGSFMYIYILIAFVSVWEG